MRIGILQAGDTNAKLAPRYGEYPDMFRSLLHRADPKVEFRNWAVFAGDFPESRDECDGWLVTGSRHGVMDDLPWIPPALDFVRASVETGVPVVGVCFGHQLLAQALGGNVVKSERGWGLGVQQYQLRERPAWMQDAPDTLKFQTIHQDQVDVQPPGSTLIAESDFCPFAMLAYGQSGFSIQAHPEFDAEFARSLVDEIRGDRVPEALAARACTTMDQPTHGREFAEWTIRFFAGAGNPD